MLEIRPVCENCGKDLPNESTEAMICTFECTFCTDCVNKILFNVCPNCGGGFEKRPSRPKDKLITNPTMQEEYRKPINIAGFKSLLEKYRNIKPNER